MYIYDSPGRLNYDLYRWPAINQSSAQTWTSGLVLLGSLSRHSHFPCTVRSEIMASQEIQWGSLIEVNQALLAWYRYHFYALARTSKIHYVEGEKT